MIKPVYASHFPVLYTDAGTQNNGKIGFQSTRIAIVKQGGEVIKDSLVGDLTNNQGEILAIIHALLLSQKLNTPHLIRSDSQLAILWARKGKTKDSAKNNEAARVAHELLEKTKSQLEWVRRDVNLAGIYLETKYKKHH